MKKNIRRLIFWTLVLLICAAIFLFSAQNAERSGALSETVTGGLVTVFRGLFPSLSDAEWGVLVALVRKLAHLFLFFLLSVFSFLALSVDVRPRRKAALFALLFCVLYAVSDEVHQFFVPGRAMLVKDVFIDSGGAVIGLLCCFLATRFRFRSPPNSAVPKTDTNQKP